MTRPASVVKLAVKPMMADAGSIGTSGQRVGAGANANALATQRANVAFEELEKLNFEALEPGGGAVEVHHRPELHDAALRR